MGNRLSRIYTRTGDKGETGLSSGRRVPKDHPRIEAIGEVDTLNSQLGLLLAELAESARNCPGLDEVIGVLTPCQHRLFDLGGELAMPEYQVVDKQEIERLEASIAADEQALHDPDLFSRDPDRFAELSERIARHRADVEAAEMRWLEVAELAEQLAR